MEPIKAQFIEIRIGGILFNGFLQEVKEVTEATPNDNSLTLKPSQQNQEAMKAAYDQVDQLNTRIKDLD